MKNSLSQILKKTLSSAQTYHNAHSSLLQQTTQLQPILSLLQQLSSLILTHNETILESFLQLQQSCLDLQQISETLNSYLESLPPNHPLHNSEFIPPELLDETPQIQIPHDLFLSLNQIISEIETVDLLELQELSDLCQTMDYNEEIPK